MRKKYMMPLGLLAVGGIIALFNSVYIVNQVEQAMVLEFGKPVRVVEEPGLHWKAPFIQNVLYFDNRLLDFNADPKEVIDAKKQPIIIDAFLRYRITDPLKYYQSVQNERGIRSRLDDILESSLRKVVGRYEYTKLLTPDRVVIMEAILRNVRIQASGDIDAVDDEDVTEAVKVAAEMGGFGIDVVDVRIKRADLSERISAQVYERMRSERERIAREFRAQGEEQAQIIRSNAEREQTVLISEARKRAEIIRGEGDATATKTYAEAFSRDKDFYDFYRSMQAYREVLRGKDTTMVLTPDSDFLKYLETMQEP